MFGDGALAAEIRDQERRYTGGADGDTIPEILNAIRGRYDLSSDDLDSMNAAADAGKHAA